MSDPVRVEYEDAPDTSDTCVVRVNRPVSPGNPLYFGSVDEAAQHPLSRKLMETGRLDALLLQDDSLTLLKPLDGASWAQVIAETRPIIEQHFAQAEAAEAAGDREMSSEEQELAFQAQEILNTDINPMVASHGGFIEVLAVKSSTLYINMTGGCQGCGMASVTVKQGVEGVIFSRLPEINEVLDTTDHASGTNPYYAPTAK